MLTNLNDNIHPFDVVIKSGEIYLEVEELPRGMQLTSDCMSTGSSVSSVSTVGGSIACAGCVFTAGTITSCVGGEEEPPGPDEEPPCPDDDGCEPP